MKINRTDEEITNLQLHLKLRSILFFYENFGAIKERKKKKKKKKKKEKRKIVEKHIFRGEV